MFSRSAGFFVPLIALWTLGALLACSAAAAAQERVSLTLMLRGGTPEREAFALQTIEAFEARYPHINVEWEIAGSGWQDQIVVRHASGVAPDVTEMFATFSQDWAEAGLLLDLRPYIERDLAGGELADFFPPIWNSGTLYHGPLRGIFYGVPRYVNLIGAYAYNVDLVEAAGLERVEDVDRRGQWTWQALREYTRKLTIRASDDQVRQWGLGAPLSARWKGWVHSNGGKVFNYPDDPFDFMLDRPEALEALEFFQSLVWDDKVVINDGGPAFERGDVAFSAAGVELFAGRFPAVIGDAFRWDIAPRAMGAAGRGVYTAKDQYGIIASTKHPDEAWELVKFLVSEEGQRLMMRTAGLMPIRISLMPEYLEMLGDKNAHHLATAVQEAIPDPMAVLVESQRTGPLIDGAIRRSVITNEVPAAVAIQEIAPVIRSIMAEAKAREE